MKDSDDITFLNAQAYVPVMEIKDETAVRRIGDIRFRMYLCKDCGHVDFYSYIVNLNFPQ